MKLSTILVVPVVILPALITGSFRDEQKKHERVADAYDEKEALVLDLLRKKSIDREKLRLYLRAFKAEKKIEVWGKNEPDSAYELIHTYEVCQSSGHIGPKRRQGDRQVPEGFYHIDRFNPYSSYHLSLGINYPNFSDRILGVEGHLGGDIFIHGACATVGCLPVTDDKIKELYIFCVEAKNCGQAKIPVTIYPARLTNAKYKSMKEKYDGETYLLDLWEDLKAGFDHFEKTHTLPGINFLDNGRHKISP